VGRSDLFSYLSAFVTIVLAVAITDMIQSTHRLIRARKRVKWDVATMVFALLVAASVVSEFFSLWATFDVLKITFLQLMWMLVIPTLFALLAYSVLPDEVPQEGLDLREFYVRERRTWVVIFGSAALLDVTRSVLIISHKWDWVLEYLGYVAIFLPPILFGLWLMWVGWSRRWDLVGVLLVTTGAIYTMGVWAISAKPDR
jgi:hypothetical protein